MVSYRNGYLNFGTKYYDYDLNFSEYLTVVEARYTAILKPNNSKVKSLLKIQCTIEIINNVLDQIEQLLKETFKIQFTLSTIKSAIILINKELILIFKEVKDFYKSLQKVEEHNRKTYDTVRKLKKEMRSFPREIYLIPEFEKNLLEENIIKEIPLLKAYLENETILGDILIKGITSSDLFGTSVLQILKLNNIFQYFNRLRALHCEFSFALLHIYFKDDCPSADRMSPSKDTMSNSYIEGLQAKCLELGEMVFETANICRRNYCECYQNRRVLIDNYRKKQELQIKQLNNLQIILRIINELNEKHDNLTGKLIKTTELYDKVHAILEKPWRELRLDASLYRTDQQPVVEPDKNVNRNRPSILVFDAMVSPNVSSEGSNVSVDII